MKNLACRYYKVPLHIKINMKGRDEQERAFLFDGLYGGKALTKREKGTWKQLERKINFNFH